MHFVHTPSIPVRAPEVRQQYMCERVQAEGEEQDEESKGHAVMQSQISVSCIAVVRALMTSALETGFPGLKVRQW